MHFQRQKIDLDCWTFSFIQRVHVCPGVFIAIEPYFHVTIHHSNTSVEAFSSLTVSKTLENILIRIYHSNTSVEAFSSLTVSKTLENILIRINYQTLKPTRILHDDPVIVTRNNCQ